MFNEPESDFCGAIHPDSDRGLICGLANQHVGAHEALDGDWVIRWDWTAFWEEGVPLHYSNLADVGTPA